MKLENEQTSNIKYFLEINLNVHILLRTKFLCNHTCLVTQMHIIS